MLIVFLDSWTERCVSQAPESWAASPANCITGRAGPLNFSMDKSRKLGWHGFVDTNEVILEVFDDLAKIKMIPEVPKVTVKFN